jgi:hypothetical protein
MKQRLESVVVHDAAGAADLLRDPVGALLNPAVRFGIDRGAVDNPLDHGVQVCQDLRVDAHGFGFGAAHTRIVLAKGSPSRTERDLSQETRPPVLGELVRPSRFHRLS